MSTALRIAGTYRGPQAPVAVIVTASLGADMYAPRL